MAPPNPQRTTRQAGQAGPADAPSPPRGNDESWVEVASQPSSSSLSSIGDDIVTTGLRVGANSYPPRRRRSTPQQQPMPASFIVGHPATQGGATSSQEEYDETESEEDRVMTSSTEAVHPLHRQTTVRASGADAESDSDDDENATALGRPSNNTPVFRPQPNAFSHPPSHLTHRHSTGSAPYYHHHHSPNSRPPIPNRPHTRSHRGPPNIMSPSYQADNDAALRASLTTLLSCAAAARGLPKHDERRNTSGAGAGILPSSQPMELRLIPESELMAGGPPPTTNAGLSPGLLAPPTTATRTASNSSAPSAPSSTSSREPPAAELPSEKTKRAATPQTRPARATKKKRTESTANNNLSPPATATTDTDTSASFISPTLLTWVVSAGVVVLVSVVGFGAGYVIGREVGRQEGATAAWSGAAGFASPSNASSCGGELVRSGAGVASTGGGVGVGVGVGGGGGAGTLRRIRWGSVGKSVTA